MEELVQQVRTILAVYLQRGRAALACLSDSRDDDAAELLRARTAAFHNFRVAVAKAEAKGWDLAGDAAARGLWAELADTNRQLAAALVAARERSLELHQRLREARRAIVNYRSGSADAPIFEKTV